MPSQVLKKNFYSKFFFTQNFFWVKQGMTQCYQAFLVLQSVYPKRTTWRRIRMLTPQSNHRTWLTVRWWSTWSTCWTHPHQPRHWGADISPVTCSPFAGLQQCNLNLKLRGVGGGVLRPHRRRNCTCQPGYNGVRWFQEFLGRCKRQKLPASIFLSEEDQHPFTSTQTCTPDLTRAFISSPVEWGPPLGTPEFVFPPHPFQCSFVTIYCTEDSVRSKITPDQCCNFQKGAGWPVSYGFMVAGSVFLWGGGGKRLRF